MAENSALKLQEFKRAFVLMQYFGYQRRNPNDPPEAGSNFDGYNFWLNKLNQFNGDYIGADMVKAFQVNTGRGSRPESWSRNRLSTPESIRASTRALR